MSRVGDLAIKIPAGVSVTTDGNLVKVTGSLGDLQMEHSPKIKVEIGEDLLKVKRQADDRIAKSLHGLTRTLISNMVSGVAQGWIRRLELVGVGYRAQMSGDKLILNVGFSHPVEFTAPAGIKFVVEENTKIVVSGPDKHLVGQIAARVRNAKPPEPYQGKGIRYAGEYVRRKAGKAGKVGAGAK